MRIKKIDISKVLRRRSGIVRTTIILAIFFPQYIVVIKTTGTGVMLTWGPNSVLPHIVSVTQASQLFALSSKFLSSLFVRAIIHT